MERYLNRKFGQARHPRFYAYPCGYLGLGKGAEAERFARYGDLVGRDFAAARTTAGGPVDPHDARRQRLRLPGFEPTYDADVTAPGFAYLEETIRQGRWAILVLPRRAADLDRRGRRQHGHAQEVPRLHRPRAALVRPDGQGVRLDRAA